MRYLLDTNIVLRLADENAKEHRLVRRAVRQITVQGDQPVLVPQVLYEFWNTGTRPLAANGFGWDSERTRDEVERLLASFLLLPETSEVFRIWLELVTTQQVSGKQVHDARLAAAVKAHDVDNLLTLNGDDFKRFDISFVHPRDLE